MRTGIPHTLLLWLALAVTLPVLGHEPPAAQHHTRDAQAIVGGSIATADAQPWMAALLRRNNNPLVSQRKFCGGSLIAATWVLTAAHCVASVQAGNIEVLVGRDDLDGSGGTLHAVSRIVINPYYDADNNVADIALLQLATAAGAQPIALPSAADAGAFVGRTGTTLGWGSTSGQNKLPCQLQFTGPAPANAEDYTCKTFVYRPLSQSRVLRSAPARVLTNAECTTRLLAFARQHNFSLPPATTDAGKLYPGTLCTHDPVGGASACYGDSGGPLLLTHNGSQHLIGITSFGLELNCQGTNHLEFYTDVSEFLAFIDSTMRSDATLEFAQLCAAAVAGLSIDIAPAAGGSSRVRLAWQPSARATGYRLVFAAVGGEPINVKERQLPLTTSAEFTLPAGSRYRVAMQAQGAACDSSISAPTLVNVP